DRTIPRFKGKENKSLMDQQTQQTCWGHGKMNWCLEILKLLETYSQELLKTEAKISQGGDVIQFFKAQTQDLDPSFPENSVVIMPSEIGGGKKNQPGPQLSITRPQVSQSYRCIEAFETKDTKNQKFKAAKNLLFFFSLVAAGWWLVENADKQIAWFPAPYLEEIDAHKDIEKVLSSLYFVVRDYESQKADELSLNNGVVVEVVKKSDDGWWLIRERNSRLNWKPELSRSLPEVEQARSSPLEHTLAMHSSKSPHLTHKDRNDSGFVESSAGDLSHSLTDPDLATCVPKVPVRPSAHEILQKCSTMTKRAVQKSSTRPALQTLLPSVH
uniref:NADPH oxidase organizer 1 n=1 Tax=Calidris pygmaea TaxID=425635 RepID=A0A8C3KE61_9CHAR